MASITRKQVSDDHTEKSDFDELEPLKSTKEATISEL